MFIFHRIYVSRKLLKILWQVASTKTHTKDTVFVNFFNTNFYHELLSCTDGLYVDSNHYDFVFIYFSICS